jgi:hypothetical protein
VGVNVAVVADGMARQPSPEFGPDSADDGHANQATLSAGVGVPDQVPFLAVSGVPTNGRPSIAGTVMFVGTVVTNDDDAENLVPLPSALVDVTPTTKYLPSSEDAGISPSTGV